MTKHKDYYGTIFHDSLHFFDNRNMCGKVFGFKLSSIGLGRFRLTLIVEFISINGKRSYLWFAVDFPIRLQVFNPPTLLLLWGLS